MSKEPGGEGDAPQEETEGVVTATREAAEHKQFVPTDTREPVMPTLKPHRTQRNRSQTEWNRSAVIISSTPQH